MTRVALALSPHLDDAAFSCGGTIHSLARRGWRVVLATIFTRSVQDPTGFALACQLDKGLDAGVDYMALRRAEDCAACNALACAPLHLNLPEAPHRGYESAPALFGGVRPEDDVGPTLADVLASLIAREAPDLILAPQAIGGHVDHVQLVHALRSFALERPVLWWQDFPYAVRTNAITKPFDADFRAMSASVVALTPADRVAKASACAAYASQIGFQFGSLAGLQTKLDEAGDMERFAASPDVSPELNLEIGAVATGL